MEKLSREKYVQKYYNPDEVMQSVMIWKVGTNESRMASFYDKGIEIKPGIEVPLFPIGVLDNDKNMIFQGDILKIIIKTKHGPVVKLGIVRCDGLLCTGIDYIDGDFITEDGDYLDEFYISEKYIVGSIIDG